MTELKHRVAALRRVRFTWSSPAVFVASFAGIILLGAFFLALPVSAAGGERIRIIDALFQCTSAVCVTGLATIDIGTRLTTFGQLDILLSIQLGGLGIMTYSLLLVNLVQKQGTPDQHEWLANVFTTDRRLSPGRMLRWIIFSTFAIEAVGAVFLYLRFAGDLGPGYGAYSAVFHAVSAFCNAGFSLFPTNLAGYRDDALVNFVVGGLIICGGLGFIVTFELWRWATGHRMWFKLLVQTKLVVWLTLAFIAGGAIFLFVFEYGNIIRGLPWSSRLLVSWFHSVTARTAGFNTVPVGQLTNSSLLLLIVLMFVGAGPGSCAGGVKLTTVGVLFMALLSRARGRLEPTGWNRNIPVATIGRAAMLLAGATVIIAVGTLLLQVTELDGVSPELARGRFLEYLFEATSAFGTVGLSTGVTPHLTTAGKIVIIAIMFIGRVGPLTLVAVLLGPRDPRTLVRYPEEDVMVG